MMPAVMSVYQSVSRLQPNAQHLALLSLRLATGWLFVGSGWGKLHHLADVTSYFASLHVMWPAVIAPLVSGLELVGGVVLMAGLMTQPWAMVLIGLMGGAIVHAHGEEIAGFADLIGLQEFLLAQTLFVLACFGAGAWSLDALCCRWQANRRR